MGLIFRHLIGICPFSFAKLKFIVLLNQSKITNHHNQVKVLIMNQVIDELSFKKHFFSHSVLNQDCFRRYKRAVSLQEVIDSVYLSLVLPDHLIP